MSNRRFDAGDDPFAEERSPESVADEIFGGGTAAPELDTGRMVAQPVDIMHIWPDRKQPRRAVPLEVGGQWDGDPQYVAGVLADWHLAAEHAMGGTIETTFLLRGTDSEFKSEEPVAAGYLDLVGLASSILNDGLHNPISVVKRGSRYLIESGERRWLAYHLLDIYAGEKYATIPAHLKKQADVWAQAAENGARHPLNAISMARQLALLVMDMYAHEDGVNFGEFENVVLPGECDRKYYAQALTHRIKRGFGSRVRAVTGLKSDSQVAQYRMLLTISDELWIEADEKNWTEFKIREESLRIRRPIPRDTFTGVKVSEEKTPTPTLPHSMGQGEKPSPPTPLPQGEGRKEPVFSETYTYPGGGQMRVSVGEISISHEEIEGSGEDEFYDPIPGPSPLPQGRENMLVAADDELTADEVLYMSISHVMVTLEIILSWAKATTQDGAVTTAARQWKTMTIGDIRRAMAGPGGKAALRKTLNDQYCTFVQFMTDRQRELQRYLERIYENIDQFEEK